MSFIKFGTDGFRGIIAREFTFETVERIIKAICLYIQKQNKPEKTIIVGYDPRFMASDFAKFIFFSAFSAFFTKYRARFAGKIFILFILQHKGG